MKSYYEWIDVLCTSNGNFHDVSYNESKYKPPEYEVKRCFDARCMHLHECTPKDALENYARGEVRIRTIEQQVRKQISSVTPTKCGSLEIWLNSLLCDGVRNGLYLKESALERILLSNIPTGTMRAIGASTATKLFDKHSAFMILCLTRLYEDSSWHDCQYQIYSRIREEDFDQRDVYIYVIDPGTLLVQPSRLYDKMTIWDEKLGGTIFAVPYPNDHVDQVVYLRLVTRFFHYLYELSIHSAYIKRIIGTTDFGVVLSNYIDGRYTVVDFFEPHFLHEALAWDMAMNKFEILFPEVATDMITNSTQGNIFWCSKKPTIISWNVNDLISNACKQRPCPGEYRMFSMTLKKALLNIEFPDDQLLNMLLATMGRQTLFPELWMGAK